MPLLSCFTICGQLEFSSAPSEAEKIYRSLRDGYRDPRTGQATIDTSVGTHQEAKLYGWAMAIAAARVTLRRAANELRPETSYAQLEAHEERFRMSPAATDTVPERRAALAAKQKAARGPRYEAVWEALGAIFGSDLVDFRPITTTEAEAYPSDPTVGPGIFRRHDAVAKSVRLLTAVSRTERDAICDCYPEDNQDSDWSLGDAYHAFGQTFLTHEAATLSAARFYLRKANSPTGTATVKIYAHTGTFGTSGKATGAALATSDTLDVSALTGTYALTTFAFSGANRITLAADTAYVAVVYYSSGAGADLLEVGYHFGADWHRGNAAYYNGATWTGNAAYEVCFYVDVDAGEETASYSLRTQDGAATLGDPNAGLSTGVSQSFTPSVAGHLSCGRWLLKKTGAPTGNAVCKLYAHSGTYGTTSEPLGTALATSGVLDVTTLTTSYAVKEFVFDDPRALLVPGRQYVLALEYTNSAANVNIRIDAGTLSTAAHAGNPATKGASVWTAATAYDCCFAVVVSGVETEVVYENWSTVGAEERILPGDILCVDPGNWGLVERVCVASAREDGDERKFTAQFSRAHSADTFATDGPVPLWSNTKRHVLIVVLAAAAINPAKLAKVNDLLRRMMRGPTTWAIVQETTPGAGTVGPFVIGSTTGSPLGAVPLEAITL